MSKTMDRDSYQVTIAGLFSSQMPDFARLNGEYLLARKASSSSAEEVYELDFPATAGYRRLRLTESRGIDGRRTVRLAFVDGKSAPVWQAEGVYPTLTQFGLTRAAPTRSQGVRWPRTVAVKRVSPTPQPVAAAKPTSAAKPAATSKPVATAKGAAPQPAAKPPRAAAAPAAGPAKSGKKPDKKPKCPPPGGTLAPPRPPGSPPLPPEERQELVNQRAFEEAERRRARLGLKTKCPQPSGGGGGGGPWGGGGGGGGGCGCGCSEFPIRYYNGEVILAVTDLAADGYGANWGHTRTYSNQMESAFDYGNGYNWLVQQWPYLTVDETDTAFSVLSGSLWQATFDLQPDGMYLPRSGGLETLVHSDSTHLFTLTNPSGEVWEFHDFDQLEFPPGIVKSLRAPGSAVIEVTAFSGELVAETQRTTTEGGTAVTEAFHYGYYDSGPAAGDLRYVTLRRRTAGGPWIDVRRAAYTYYEPSDPNGLIGDLKTAVQQVLHGTAWVDTRTYYYRYYTDVASAHLLKFVLEPSDFVNLKQAVANPFSASDTVVARYAANYFEYDSLHQVTRETVEGGSRTFLFAYIDSGYTADDDYNRWQRKTVETLPDGTQKVVYTNFIGQVLLSELKNGSDSWVEYHEFDADANEVLMAHPSAVASYTEGTDTLNVVIRDHQGLVETTEFYQPPDPAAGYVKNTFLQEGAQGTPIPQMSYEFVSRSDDPVTPTVTVQVVSKLTSYRNTDGSGEIETRYEYEWFDGTVQVKQRTTILPTIPTDQNGSGLEESRTEICDERGFLVWERGPRGFISHFSYDSVLGTLTQSIHDVDTTKISGVPAGWSTPPGGGLHVVTDFEYDALRRMTQKLGPEHEVNGTTVRTAEWTAFDDVGFRTISAQGYVTGLPPHLTFTLVNPVRIAVGNGSGHLVESVRAAREQTCCRPTACETFPRSSWVGWTTNVYDREGRLTAIRSYHVIPDSGEGLPNENYYEADYGYDSRGRRNFSRSPGGTIRRTVFDPRGLPIAEYVGTNDAEATDESPTGEGAPGNNMTVVDERTYDDGGDGGDGILTRSVAYVDAANTRVTDFAYDFRNRKTSTDGEEDFYEETVYDNLSRATRVDRRNTSVTGQLTSRRETLFDDRGRIYRTLTYGVNPSNGSINPNVLTDDAWYDASGNKIKSLPSGARRFLKRSYDGLGREHANYVGYYTGTGDEDYAEAAVVNADDKIFHQTLTTYDAADNVLLVADFERFHDAIGNGPLNPSTGAQPKARVSYFAGWHDGVGRLIANANYGTFGGQVLVRPPVPPDRTDDVLVTTTAYDVAGRSAATADPSGRLTTRTYDDLNRPLVEVVNVRDECAGYDANLTVRRTYDADSHVTAITVRNAVTGDQTTSYEYGVTLDDGPIASNDLLRSVTYPAAAESVHNNYNRREQVTRRTDRNGAVHEFDFDKLGRSTNDRVTIAPAGIDASVRRLSTSYDVRGAVRFSSSYDAPSGGAVVNQVRFDYDDFVQLIAEFQMHSGTVGAGTPKTAYAYADGSANNVRPTGITYPDVSRNLVFDYASGDDDRLSRVTAVNDGTSTRATYVYFGHDKICRTNLAEPATVLDMTYQGSTDDPYSGCLDRFGRVIQFPWVRTGAPVAGASYQYDRAGNRTRMQPLGFAATDALQRYYYDEADRLVRAIRGLPDGLSEQETWSLDPTGNWIRYDMLDVGDPTRNLAQSRSADSANAITSISRFYGPDWPTPTYDRVGNTIEFPDPRSSAALTATYDAWNRLVSVGDETYEYDALMRRTTAASGGTTRHFYYSKDWQILEERINGTASADRQFVWGLRHVDDLICRQGGSTRLYGLQDVNGNLAAITDTGGAITQRYRYVGYGGPTRLTPSGAVASGTDAILWEFLFGGYRYDRITGLYQVRYRYLHPSLGRFLTRDPVEYAGGYSLYAYVNDRPTVKVDPSGLTEYAECMQRASAYCAAAAATNDMWTQCACNVSYLICQAAAAQGIGRKAAWLYCTNKCMFKKWLAGHNLMFPTSKAVAAAVEGGYKLEEPTATWKTAAASKNAAGQCCACDKQVDAEQTGLEECKAECGAYDNNWGKPFDTLLPGDATEYLKKRFGVNLPDFDGDFNNLQDRVKYGVKVCC